jgi:hypothetical protein
MQTPLPSHWSFCVWLLPSSHDVPSMAMMNCTECAHAVSDRAAACPQCGCPIAAPTPAPTQTLTIEATAKKWKLMNVQARGCAALGIVILTVAIWAGSVGLGVLSGLVLLVAVGWLGYSEFGQWWHHG